MNDEIKINFTISLDEKGLKILTNQIVESSDRILKRFSALEKLVSIFASQERKRDEKMADTLDDIFAEAERNTNVGNSIVTLVERLLTQQGVDPARRDAILAALRADNDRLEAVVLANTPAEPPTE